MKNRKIIVAAAVAAAAVAALVAVIFRFAGGSLDVVGRQSAASLDAVLGAIPDQVKADEMNGGWSLASPDGAARFIWSGDFSKSPLYDVMLEADAKPFTDAGLDPARLPSDYAAYGGMLRVGAKLGNEALTYSGGVTPMASFEEIVKRHRGAINYHTALDHYGVKLGGGNMFEWARDMLKNTVTNADQDKDIVFVLNPEPLIAAGVDPAKVEGWAYAQVEAEEDGKTSRVYKFLKPFNLK